VRVASAAPKKEGHQTYMVENLRSKVAKQKGKRGAGPYSPVLLS
jgi:hypothetical protein